MHNVIQYLLLYYNLNTNSMPLRQESHREDSRLVHLLLQIYAVAHKNIVINNLPQGWCICTQNMVTHDTFRETKKVFRPYSREDLFHMNFMAHGSQFVVIWWTCFYAIQTAAS